MIIHRQRNGSNKENSKR